MTSRHKRRPHSMKAGDHIYVKLTGRYLGVVSEVRRYSVRFNGPWHTKALASRHEIRVGLPPDEEQLEAS